MSKATSDNITKFPTTPPPAEPPVKLEDEWLYNATAEWRIARAKQAIAWAEQDRAELGGWREGDFQLDTSALETMQTLEYHIGRATPRTVMTARAMMEMAIEILAYEGINPDHTFASGPVLDIVRNCLRGFETLSGPMPLRIKKLESTDGEGAA